MDQRQRRLWLYQINQLRKNFDPGVSVTVRTVLLKDDATTHGVIKSGRLAAIQIRIKRKKCFTCRCDSLMHEWAHAMEWAAHWSDDSPKKEHGETWGVWYAKIYQHLIDTCWQDMREKGLLHKDHMGKDY